MERLWSGWHVAFYVASFSPAFQSVLGLGLNLLDHPYLDKSPDLPAALANHQFRFKARPAACLFGAGSGEGKQAGWQAGGRAHAKFVLIEVWKRAAGALDWRGLMQSPVLICRMSFGLPSNVSPWITPNLPCLPSGRLRCAHVPPRLQPHTRTSTRAPKRMRTLLVTLQDIVHLDEFGQRGELLYCLGHEVRSLHHPGYLRPLHNRRDFAHE